MKISTIFQRLGILTCLLNAYGLGVQAQSQTYKPMLQDGKMWYYRSIYPVRGADYVGTFRIDGDSVVDGVAYKKCYSDDSGEAVDLLREEDKKVFGEKNNETGYGPDCKGLYYDFSLEEGDTAIVYLGGSVKAYQVDTIKVDGETYRRLYIDYSDGWMLAHREYWVEGVGSSWGFYPAWRLDGFGAYDELDSCTVDGKLLFSRNDFVRVPHSKRQWVLASYSEMHGGNSTWLSGGTRRTYAAMGETELNGETYETVYDYSVPIDDPLKKHEYLFAMRSEAGRVLADAESYHAVFADTAALYPVTEEGEVLLYDYNTHVGDAYLGHANITVVQEGDTILADGQSRRMLVLSTGHRLVEGIGCVNAGGTPFDYLGYDTPVYVPKGDYYDAFVSFTLLENYYDEEGRRIYSNTREKAYDAILAGVKPVVSQSTNRTDASAVYDLQGRRMDGRNLPKGIYIQGGRKFVVK